LEPKPLVSVVVPCRNRAHFLKPTIDSILEQSYPRIECIVVDAASLDGTVELLKGYGARIRWISEPDGGHADAINKGWKMSAGEILAWLNADDMWAVPDSVTTAVDYLIANPDADVVYGESATVNEEGEAIGWSYVRDWDLRHAVEHCDHCICQPAAFFRRSIIEKTGGLDVAFISKKDHELWLRIALAGTIRRIPGVLARERACPGTWATRGDITAWACVALTRKFYSLPGVPESLLEIKSRAISNSYRRGMDYAWYDGRHWTTILYYAFRGILADWSNRWHVKVRLDSYLREGGKENVWIRALSKLLFA